MESIRTQNLGIDITAVSPLNSMLIFTESIYSLRYYTLITENSYVADLTNDIGLNIVHQYSF